MATITEIGRMVVRLVGDATMYANMLKQARADTDTAVAAIKESFSELTAFFQAFGERARQELALEGILTSHGSAVTVLTARYKEFARETQNSTTVGYNNVLMLLRQAESHGVSGDAAERAVRNAIALGTANSKSAQMYLKATAALELGNSQMLYRTIPSLRGVKSEAERNVLAQAKLADMWGVVTTAASSAGGQIDQLANSWRGLTADLGSAAAPVAGPVVGFFKDLVEWLRGLPQWVQTALVSIMAVVAGLTAMQVVIPLVVTWATVLQNALIRVGVALAAIPLAGWIVLATAAVVVLVQWIGKLVGAEGAINAFQKSLEKNKELQDQMTQQATGQTSRMMAEANALQGTDRRRFLETTLRREERNLAGLRARQPAAEEAVGTGFLGWAGRQATGPVSLVSTGSWSGASAPQRAELESINRLLPVTRDRVNQLRAALAAMSDAALQARLTEEIDKLTKKMELAAATVGMNSFQQRIYQLTVDGATEAQLRHLRALDARIEAEKKSQQLQKDVNTFTSDLNAQVETFGMGRRELQLYNLAARGATDGQLMLAAALSETLDELEAHNELLKEAEGITKRFEDPQVKFTNTMIRLNDMLGQGLISWEAYSRALADAEKHLQGVDAAAKNAVGSSSLEALSRVAEYTRKLNDQMEGSAKAAQASPAMPGRPPGGDQNWIWPQQPPRPVLEERAPPWEPGQPVTPAQAAAAAAAIVEMAGNIRQMVQRPGWMLNFAGLGGGAGGG
jgi:hypothetical protein